MRNIRCGKKLLPSALRAATVSRGSTRARNRHLIFCPPCARGEQMLSCKKPGGLFAICELGNGALCAPFPDRARFLPRERVPNEVRREGCKDAMRAPQPLRLAFGKPPSRRRKGNAASVTVFAHNGKNLCSPRAHATPWRCVSCAAHPLTQGRLSCGQLLSSCLAPMNRSSTKYCEVYGASAITSSKLRRRGDACEDASPSAPHSRPG